MSAISEIESLEDEIYNDGIDVIDAHFSPTKKAACLHKEDVYKAIVIDMSAIDGHAEEFCVLAEEYSHYEAGMLYFLEATINMPNDESNRLYCEAQAKRHKILKYLPFERIQEAVDSGCNNEYELAEEVGRTVEFVLEAIEFYERKGLRLKVRED